MKTIGKIDGAWGGRFPIYRITEAVAIAWNPSVRAWEVYRTELDGSINDIYGTRKSRVKAEEFAMELNH